MAKKSSLERNDAAEKKISGGTKLSLMKSLRGRIFLFLFVLLLTFCAICTVNMFVMDKIEANTGTLNEKCIPVLESTSDFKEQLFTMRLGMSQYITIADKELKTNAYNSYKQAATDIFEAMNQLQYAGEALENDEVLSLKKELEDAVAELAKHSNSEMTMCIAGRVDDALAEFIV